MFKSKLLVASEDLIAHVFRTIEKGCIKRGIPARAITIGYNGDEWFGTFFHTETGNRVGFHSPSLWWIYDAINFTCAGIEAARPKGDE